MSHPKHKSKTIDGSLRAAEQFLAERIAERHKASYVESSALTLNEFLDEWFEVVKGSLGVRTFKEYNGQLRRYVRPTLGERALQSLRPQDIQKVYSDMMNSEKSPRTIQLTHANLRKALQQAVQWRKLETNPCDAVAKPKNKHTEMRYFSLVELKHVLAVAEGGTHDLFLHLLAYTGIRTSEAQGLKWKDLDLNRGRLHIRRSIKKVDGRWIEEPPKTLKGKRTLALPQTLIERLSKEYGGNPEGYVFSNDQGEPLSYSTLLERFKRVQQAAGLHKEEQMGLHGLRHTHATVLKEAGRDIQDIGDRLGHASPYITAILYTHFSEERQRQMSETLENLFPCGSTKTPKRRRSK